MRIILLFGALAAVASACGESNSTSPESGTAGAALGGSHSSDGAGRGGGGAENSGGASGNGEAGSHDAVGGSTSSAGDAGSGGGGDASGAGEWVWQSKAAVGEELNAAWTVDANDVWAAGDDGTLVHWDGKAWSHVDAATRTHLAALWGSSASDLWAVGGGIGGEPNLVHFDGTKWSAVDAGTNANLSAIWGSARDDVWAAGSSGIITHYDGGHWTLSYQADQTDLIAFYAIAGSGAGDVWAVGATLAPRPSGRHAAVHWSQGGPWTTDPSASFPEGARALWSFGTNDVWALGENGALHFDGSTWTENDDPALAGLLGLWGSATGHLTAVGAGRIEEFDGATWTEGDSRTATLYAVTGASDDDRWAVGTAGTILHFESGRTSRLDCAAIGGECVAGSSCAGLTSDYPCSDSGITCCVVATACQQTTPPLACHDGEGYCPYATSGAGEAGAASGEAGGPGCTPP